MLSKHSTDQREQLEVVALSELVPEDHLVRKMEEAVDFSFIYEKVAPLYSSKGRPSINPAALIQNGSDSIRFWASLHARNHRTGFCEIKTQAWPALDNPAGKEKIVHAGDACFRCHESKKACEWTWKGPNRRLFHRKNKINWTKIGRILEIRPILSTV